MRNWEKLTIGINRIGNGVVACVSVFDDGEGYTRTDTPETYYPTLDEALAKTVAVALDPQAVLASFKEKEDSF